MDEPHYATVSRLSLVDLAGSERHANTKTSGAQLREASNINRSLMTLSQCIKDIRWNQQHGRGAQRMPPFRDSKLTRLFQTYLEGKGTVRMIVNISACASAFDETSHVLQFSAVARKVKEVPVVSRINTGLNGSTAQASQSMLSSQPLTHPEREQARAQAEELEIMKDYNETLQDRIYELQTMVMEMEKTSKQLESRIREEVAEEMAQQLVEVEESYQSMMRQNTDITTSTYEKKLALLTHSVARSATRRRMKKSPRPTRAKCAALAVEEEDEEEREQDGNVPLTPRELESGTKVALLEEKLKQTKRALKSAESRAEASQRDLRALRARSAEELSAVRSQLLAEKDKAGKAAIEHVQLRNQLDKSKEQAKEQAVGGGQGVMEGVRAALKVHLCQGCQHLFDSLSTRSPQAALANVAQERRELDFESKCLWSGTRHTAVPTLFARVLL